MQDTLLVQADNGLIAPAWVNPMVLEEMLLARKRFFQSLTETAYMTRIRGGPLLTDMVEQMEQKQNGNLTRNIAIYSAHDSTLANLMKALDVIDQTTVIPNYGATLALELHCGNYVECIVKVSKLNVRKL